MQVILRERWNSLIWLPPSFSGRTHSQNTYTTLHGSRTLLSWGGRDSDGTLGRLLDWRERVCSLVLGGGLCCYAQQWWHWVELSIPHGSMPRFAGELFPVSQMGEPWAYLAFSVSYSSSCIESFLWGCSGSFYWKTSEEMGIVQMALWLT